MRLLRTRHVLAFDAAAVAGGAVSKRLGSRRLRTLARGTLSPGALDPSAFDPNLLRADEVRDAVQRVAEALAPGRSRICVVLPDGVARIALLEAPLGVDVESFARFRLASGLPYPVGEAIVDALALPGRLLLAAAVRRRVVEEYEQAVRGAGLSIERVELAPLAAVAALRRDPAYSDSVDLILGDVAYSLAAWRSGRLRVFRNRRRDRGADEGQRLWDEVRRTAALAGEATVPRVRVVGPGAAGLLPVFAAGGGEAQAGWSLEGGPAVEAAELAWLGGALA